MATEIYPSVLWELSSYLRHTQCKLPQKHWVHLFLYLSAFSQVYFWSSHRVRIRWMLSSLLDLGQLFQLLEQPQHPTFGIILTVTLEQKKQCAVSFILSGSCTHVSSTICTRIAERTVRRYHRNKDQRLKLSVSNMAHKPLSVDKLARPHKQGL